MKLISLIARCVVALFCVNAFAADDADNANDNGNWDFQLTPLYYWSINISGSADSDTPDPPIDLGGFDLEFKGAFSLNFDAVYKERWGLIFDTVAVNLNNQENDDDTLYLDFKYQQSELTGFYRLKPGRSSWDIFAGARYYTMDVSLEGTPVTIDPSWVDPIVGARWIWKFADKWKLNLRGDIGGFGVGSDFVWQAWATVDWFPWKHVGFIGGARALDLDYESSGTAANIKIWGPVLGFTFRW